MAHLHSVYDTDKHFTIDPITKVITNQATNKIKLMQFDHNSERFTFEIPRYVEGHDMTLCNKVVIHYNNINNATKEQNKDIYLVDDLQLSPESEDVVIFSWLIKETATIYAGSLNFFISFKCMTGATVDYRWSPDMFKGISVGEGEDNGAAIAEEYSDILEAWKADVSEELQTIRDEMGDFVKTSDVAEIIEKEVQSITSIDTIYEDVENLPRSAENGTRYVAKTNGGNPWNIYKFDATAGEWVFVAEVLSNCIYNVLDKDYFDNVLYRFSLLEEIFIPLQVETQINLSNVDDIYAGIDKLKEATPGLGLINGDNRIVGVPYTDPSTGTLKAKAPLHVYTYDSYKNTWKKKLQLNNHTVYMCNSYSKKYSAQAYSLYRCRPNYVDFKLLNNPYGNADLKYTNTNICFYNAAQEKTINTTLGLFYKYNDSQITGDNIPLRTKEGYMKCNTPVTAGDDIVANTGYIKKQKGAKNGIATLDKNGKVPASQLDFETDEWKLTYEDGTTETKKVLIYAG